MLPTDPTASRKAPLVTKDRPKDPAKVRAGKRGMATRWGPARIVRIADLTPSQRRLVVALVAAARQEGAPTEATSTT